MPENRVELEKVSPVDEAQIVRPGYPRAPGYPDAMPYSYGYAHSEDDEDSINLREIWRIIRKRKWLILCITVIVTTLVTIEAYRGKSTYKASAFIEIGKDSPTVRSAASGMVIQADDDLYYPQLSINTNLFRLTSEPLLEDVVADLKLDQNPKFSEPTRRSFWEAVKAVVSRVTLHKPEAEPPTTIAGLISGQGRLIRSPEEREKLGPFVSMVAGGLQAEQVKETRTLKVTYTHTDPVICAAVANGVAQDFIDQNFENKTERFTSASKWLDTTTRELKAKVERADADLSEYTRNHNIFATEGKETLTTDKLTRLHDQATRAQTERTLKQSVYDMVKAGRMAELPAVFSDLKLNKLQSDLDDQKAELERPLIDIVQQHQHIQDQTQNCCHCGAEGGKGDNEEITAAKPHNDSDNPSAQIQMLLISGSQHAPEHRIERIQEQTPGQNSQNWYGGVKTGTIEQIPNRSGCHNHPYGQRQRDDQQVFKRFILDQLELRLGLLVRP